MDHNREEQMSRAELLEGLRDMARRRYSNDPSALAALLRDIEIISKGPTAEEVQRKSQELIDNVRAERKAVLPMRAPPKAWVLFLAANVASVFGVLASIGMLDGVRDAVAEGQLVVGLRQRGSVGPWLNVATYLRTSDPVLFWAHVGSFVALGLLLCLVAGVLWLSFVLRVAGYPPKRVPPGASYVLRALHWSIVAVGVYWVAVFFGLRSLAGWLL